jgi:hypothetical protein
VGTLSLSLTWQTHQWNVTLWKVTAWPPPAPAVTTLAAAHTPRSATLWCCVRILQRFRSQRLSVVDNFAVDPVSICADRTRRPNDRHAAPGARGRLLRRGGPGALATPAVQLHFGVCVAASRLAVPRVHGRRGGTRVHAVAAARRRAMLLSAPILRAHQDVRVLTPKAGTDLLSAHGAPTSPRSLADICRAHIPANRSPATMAQG